MQTALMHESFWVPPSKAQHLKVISEACEATLLKDISEAI